MYSLTCYYHRRNQALIKEAVKYLPEVVFDCWKIVPTFVVDINDACDEDEFEFTMNYDDPQDNDQTVLHGHEAFNLAQAFVYGWLLAKGTSIKA